MINFHLFIREMVDFDNDHLFAVSFPAGAIVAREPWMLLGLLAMNLAYYLSAQLSVRNLWRDIRFFLVQMAIILVLYLIKYGIAGHPWGSVTLGTPSTGRTSFIV